MSQRRIKRFKPCETQMRPPEPERAKDAEREFRRYHAKETFRRLPAAIAPSLIVWGFAKAGIGGELITSYGADVFGPLATYAVGRMAYYYDVMDREGNAPEFTQSTRPITRGIAKLARSRGQFAAELFLACAGTEIAQHYHIIGGTFDPKDIAAFGAGIALALLFEKAVEPKAKG